MTTHGSFAGKLSIMATKPTALLANNNSGFQAYMSCWIHTRTGDMWEALACMAECAHFKFGSSDAIQLKQNQVSKLTIQFYFSTLTLPGPTPGISAWLTSITALPPKSSGALAAAAA